MAASILVVDDDVVLGRVLTRVLTGDGWHTVAACDADEALELARQHHPQLALIDLCMPATDGVETARRLLAECPNLALILLTAYPVRLEQSPEMAMLFARVLIKPLDLTALRGAVRGVLTGGDNSKEALCNNPLRSGTVP